MLRIEGLKEALINGSFPDKVQTNWCYGWGYAVSAMYGDMILLPSAILRLLGFPLITCYKLYIILINLGTAFSSYYAFNKISKNRLNSVLVSFLYTCAPYRLCCIYIRSAMGEYSAFLFFPLIILAFYYMFEENDTPEYGKRILLPSLGFAGLLQTHILSCIMSSIFIIIYLIVNYKKLICRKRLIYIAKIAVSSVLLSVWFLIPFLRFSREPLIVYSDSSWNYEIQWYGASISELFAQIAGPSTNFNFAYNTGLTERMPLSIGNGLVTILILFLCFRNKMNSKNTRTIKICTLLGCLSAFLCSIYFPYNKLHDLLPKLSGFISTIQFPYRFISTTVVLLSVASVLILNNLALSINKHTFHLLICIVFIIGFHQSISLLYNSIYHGSFITYYDSVNLRSNELMGYQYLYEGTDYSIPEREHEVTGNDSNIINVDNSSNSYIITCNSTGTDSFIELPLYYYPGDIAKDSDNNRLNLDRGSNNRIRVMLPEDFDGEITVKYSEPMIWHVMEMISLFTFFALIIYEIRSKKTNIKQENTPDGDDEKNLE
ncbi:MAG: hypothetical protein J5517_02115 [Eubacterium sp.]|nr:hypothetical protein [Eubacterium sp.]